jgi:protoporphyrinogen oxidase
MTDQDLIDQVTDTLEAMAVISKDMIIYAHVIRQPFAYVVYDLDYQKNMRVVKDYCRSIGIPLVGRFAQFEYLNMDGCIRSAMDFIRTSS